MSVWPRWRAHFTEGRFLSNAIKTLTSVAIGHVRFAVLGPRGLPGVPFLGPKRLRTVAGGRKICAEALRKSTMFLHTKRDL